MERQHALGRLYLDDERRGNKLSLPGYFHCLKGSTSRCPPLQLLYSRISVSGSLEEGRLGLRSLIGARGRLPLLLQLCCRRLTVGSKPCD
ncbi:hypothetical protein NQZ68_007421 [Dissostichus eleginoides]|nr:hypothetical protein NQZ68_007421 [Dissostichus eleginoides]